MTNHASMPLNLSGLFSVSGPNNYTDSELKAIGLELVRKKLETTFSCKKTNIDVSMKSANIFSDSGEVNVGEFCFDVHHYPEQMCSGAKVTIEPPENEFGHGYYKASLGAYVSPNEVFVTSCATGSKQETKIVSVKIDGDQLVINVGDNLSTGRKVYTHSLSKILIINN